MTDSPASCPNCGAMLRIFEAEAGAYIGCDEPGCEWMSEPINLAPGESDLEVILRDSEIDPGTE